MVCRKRKWDIPAQPTTEAALKAQQVAQAVANAQAAAQAIALRSQNADGAQSTAPASGASSVPAGEDSASLMAAAARAAYAINQKAQMNRVFLMPHRPCAHAIFASSELASRRPALEIHRNGKARSCCDGKGRCGSDWRFSRRPERARAIHSRDRDQHLAFTLRIDQARHERRGPSIPGETSLPCFHPPLSVWAESAVLPQLFQRSGAVVTCKGRYRAPGDQSGDERPLYLHISADTQDKLERCALLVQGKKGPDSGYVV